MEMDKRVDSVNVLQELRKQMKWYFKGHTMLNTKDINEYCSQYGLNFNEEMVYAREIVKLEKMMDEYVNMPEEKQVIMQAEIESTIESIRSDLEKELSSAEARKQLREEMRSYFSGESNVTVAEINEKCNNLELNYNYEMREEKDKNKGSVTKIKSKEVEEIVSKIMNDDDCVYMVHGTGIGVDQEVVKRIYEETKDEDDKYIFTKEAIKNIEEHLYSVFHEGLYMRDNKIDISAVNLETQVKYNKAGNRFVEEDDGGVGKKKPETSKGILKDYIENGYEKYPYMNGMVILGIPKKCLDEKLPLFEYDEKGKVLSGVTGAAMKLHYRIPKEYIKGAIFRDRLEIGATYFFENELYDKNKDINNDKESPRENQKVEEIIKQMKYVNQINKRSNYQFKNESDKIAYFHDQKSEQYFEDMKTGKYTIPTSKIGKATINTPAKVKQEADRVEEENTKDKSKGDVSLDDN